MKKLSFLGILSLFMAAVMCGCASKQSGSSSEPRVQDSVSKEQIPESSSIEQEEKVDSSVEAELAAPLPAEFFNSFAHFAIMMGMEDFSTPDEFEQQMYENVRGFGGDTSCMMLWLILQTDINATRYDCPTRFDLTQYADSDEGVYSVPADVMHDAILSWTQVDFDVTQYDHTYGENNEYSHGAYRSETDTVDICIDGLGDPFPYSTGNPRIIEQGDVIVAEVDLQDYTPTEGASEDFTVSPITIKVQCNADDTYTLLSADGFPGWETA